MGETENTKRKNKMKDRFNYSDYERLETDLKSIAVLVESLNNVTDVKDEHIRENCFILIADMINDKAEIADDLFNNYLISKKPFYKE